MFKQNESFWELHIKLMSINNKYLTPVRLAIIKNSTKTNVGEDVGEKSKASCTVGKNVNWCRLYVK